MLIARFLESDYSLTNIRYVVVATAQFSPILISTLYTQVVGAYGHTHLRRY